MNDFTILITTFNRPRCLLRNLKFLLSHDISFKIFIADSSNDINKNDELETLIEENNVSFKKFPHDMKVAQKISEAIKYVSTKYCVLCADDDFIIPTSVIECINFLKNNADYASCHGKYYLHTNFEYISRFGIVFRDQSPVLIGSEENSSFARVNTFIDKDKLAAQYPFYAVFETINLKIVWQQIAIYANDWFFNDYFSTIVRKKKKKMKTLPIFYMSREPNSYLWQNQKKLEILFSEQAKMRCSEGIVKNLSRYYNNLDLDQIKKKHLNILEKKKQKAMIKINKIGPNINKDNILKYCFRRFFYLYLKILFRLNNQLNSDSVKKLENLIIESGDPITEVKESREQY